MNKYLLLGFWFIAFSFSNLYGQKSKLHFNPNGEFKIVQFTDMHMQKHDAELELASAREIVALEKPDLVIITGDITCQDSVAGLLLKLADVFAEKGIPWAVALGNHDNELGTSRIELSALYRSLPFNINSITSDIKGVTNYVLPIAGKMDKNAAILYIFDSNEYSSFKDGIKEPDQWITLSQINWYRNKSAVYAKKNKEVPVPSLAFFHIPVPEYKVLWDSDSTLCVGSKQEKVCYPAVNSGLYAAMLENGDVMGIFVGHDHENDYIGSYNGIALAYGRFSGGTNTYGSLTRGARVIVLEEGKKEFNTWIREFGGKVLYPCIFKNGQIIK